MSTLKLENIKHENSSTNNMVMDSDGSVSITNKMGIGTSTPDYQLDLQGGATNNERLRLLRGTDDTNQFMTMGWNNISTHRANVALASAQTNLSFNQVGSDGTRTAMAINGSGHVTKPYQPAFKAHSSASGWQSFGTTNEAVMPFNTTQHNVGNHYNTSNYRFVAPVNGVYYFTSQVYHDGNTQLQHRIRLNGSALTFSNNRTQGTSVGASVTIQLSVNDYVDVTAKISNSDATDWFADPSYAFLCGFLIG